MLAGEKVRLRALELEDLDHCLKWLNDWNVVRNLSAVWYPISREAQRAWMEHHTQDDDPAEKTFVIESLSGQYLGNCGLELIDYRNSKARVGIVIGMQEYWDKGLGREALKLLALYAFDFLNLRKLYLDVYGFNQRALKCYLEVGFVQEGTFRKEFFRDGEYHDILCLGMFKEELK